jgi:hypothetical protein
MKFIVVCTEKLQEWLFNIYLVISSILLNVILNFKKQAQSKNILTSREQF